MKILLRRMFVSTLRVQSRRLYDVRHTCATLLLAAGVNPKIVSERLGHSSVVLTLNTYSHALPGMQEVAAKNMDRWLQADKVTRHWM